MLASLIPGARLVPLASRNQMALEQEAVWQRVIAEIDDFLLHSERSPGRVQLPFDQLTARERDILECIAQGLDNSSIAKRLGIREKTVRNHISRLFSKLGLNSRSRVIVLAREAGFGRV